MNRREASRQATESTRSWGDLRRLIEAARGRGGMSRLNPGLTHEQALDMLAAGIKGRPDDEVPTGLKDDIFRPGRQKRTRDSLIVQNILRECA
jgi:hypothetical protein